MIIAVCGAMPFLNKQSGAPSRHYIRSIKMHISDVMIHVDESLNDEARDALEASMREIEGVVAPRFNAGKTHLLMIAYDPGKTTTAVLLEKTRAAGYTAQLVGM
jgi:hypothetical protein